MNWETFIANEREKNYFKQLDAFIAQERQTKTIFPKQEYVFNAFQLCPLANVKVVILGQDPYFNDNQAHGLSFSVLADEKLPPSLKNMYKELASDLTIIRQTGDLTHWAKQGVLLLNAVLTVEKGKPNSHANCGWERFTDAVIQYVNDTQNNVVFVLWGSYAQKKETLITNETHLILKAPHPSPLSAYRGFFGSQPYSKINAYLIANGKTPIDWGE